MSIYDDFSTVIPEDKREAFKSALSQFDGAVKIASREDAEKLFESNDFIKSAKDAYISKATEAHDKNFKEKTLPGLIQEELKKNVPKPKDPELAAALERVEAL
jgi:3-methyladenine DNA glycosylase Tag